MTSMLILDRDGVINHDSDEYIKTVDEWIPIKGSLEAITRLKKAGHLITVATNQSGIGRGMFSEETLEAMHQKLHDLLGQRGVAIDGIYYCPHTPSDNCVCRKPKPGLLLQIAQAFSIDLKQAIFVGDSFSDIQAARMVGAQPVLLRTGKGPRTLAKYGPLENVPVYDDLSKFALDFLKGNKS